MISVKDTMNEMPAVNEPTVPMESVPLSTTSWWRSSKQSTCAGEVACCCNVLADIYDDAEGFVLRGERLDMQ